MINVICFSKDRPLQLHAYITSLKQYAKIKFDLHVIYKCSNDDFQHAYDELTERFDDVNMIKETHINANIMWALDNSTAEFIMFGCDDVLFTDYFDDDILRLIALDSTMGFSLRLGKNTTYCHPANKQQAFNGSVYGNICSWDWTKNINNGDFGYPFELDATIYKKGDVLNYLLHNLNKSNSNWHPNLLEAAFMVGHYQHFLHRNVMYCYKEPRCVVITVNRVQDVSPNRIYDEYSTEELLIRFQKGDRIDIDYYHKKLYKSIHIGELKLK